ncbi:MAG TPA: ABC transporter permease [Deltaproteobacteria bacterium]|nr:ABC transporter permease [Deltaproteobacteria bacterium]
MWNPYVPLGASQRRTLSLVGVVSVLISWSLLSGLGLVGPAKLPAPWDVGGALVRLSWDVGRGESPLLIATLWSTSRVLVAGMLVIVIGVPAGVAMGASPKIDAIFSPLIDPFRSAPIVAVLPILVMWLGIGELMKITFLFLGAVVYLVPMVRDAVRSVPHTYFTSARDLGATELEAVRLSLLPMAMPRIADAITVAVSVMWTYITVAEYINAERGLGQLIQNARRFSAMDQVFAGIFVIIALALITYSAMVALRRRVFHWETT